MSVRSILIANRGEIALRIIRACRTLGLRTIAVCSEADRGAAYLALADRAVCIGGAAADTSYLDIGAVMLAAAAVGADAIHPGYGFLSENGDFAEAVEGAGLIFIGPTSDVVRLMGDKIAAKAKMRELGVPCVAGSHGALPDDPQLCQACATEVGYPLIIKAAGGGGGRGMRIVRDSASLHQAIGATREEARRAFANPTIYLEKFLEHPRHVEIQVICDGGGEGVWLGARDCSMQRRHQKLIEEAPPPGVPEANIAELGERCVAACRAIGYRGVGTFEFLYQDGIFAFIEMNTRIQVEHPITEETSGIDIVREQIRVALGEPLGLRQSEVTCRGHAIECRINAEHPFDGIPSPGRVESWLAPGGPGIRVDTHIVAGSEVPSHYDSLIAKVIARGEDRSECIERMLSALADLRAEGIRLNTELHSVVLKDASFRDARLSIHSLEDILRRRASSDRR
ncbi:MULTISPECIES: acetyl-CoA carboxylase biotin carboxylase subunit [Bradyrhizobium]|uniref:biotin carboxylase n=3 Tax=Bradyrhizobium TaxID=374 RepID=A0A410VJ89_9BRAD|nr:MULTISPECIES: acetyl-CoA carboxylase biotin carboxylase subunit [Bradyrhizobium]MCG2629344.1 acetyl-CoA carboxylase biotin carboxylase subunit [Bradyrhizobium zhengyangense]MCG2644625.1 acetyl-CoA carboxylase biotin carboxylase subunit [Bradyrhizobium zhengyangense]MCG2670858.1 acetyl-CoA carboxylase biotin carboxylase subunit [Bradyrhizobium zhengyangense]MDN4984491.1 acetyl-CoA carboxylase biotin carboxylase subunit [Bradyrhizobium sp. WYCCWR 13022]MDN5002483.1 acetyl-CoA carboxylase biot